VTAYGVWSDGDPEVLSRDAVDVDAREYKGRDDFGVAAVDWRSMVFTPAV
jgi:hypothetical protein